MTPAATLKLLNDATVDLDDWITKEVNEAVALQEGRDFRSGNGVNQPKSFLSYDAVLGKRMELGGSRVHYHRLWWLDLNAIKMLTFTVD